MQEAKEELNEAVKSAGSERAVELWKQYEKQEEKEIGFNNEICMLNIRLLTWVVDGGKGTYDIDMSKLDDIQIDALPQFLRRIERFDVSTGFRLSTWIKSADMMFLKKASGISHEEKELSLDDPLKEESEDTFLTMTADSKIRLPEGEMGLRLLREKLVQAKEGLSPRQKEIVDLVYLQGVGTREVAERIGTSKANVIQTLGVALRKMRAELRRMGIQGNGSFE